MASRSKNNSWLDELQIIRWDDSMSAGISLGCNDVVRKLSFDRINRINRIGNG